VISLKSSDRRRFPEYERLRTWNTHEAAYPREANRGNGVCSAAHWLEGLRDIRARARILARVARLATGHAGDVKPVGEGVSEMRIDYGPGYRVYFIKRGHSLVILLAGGDKSSQRRDIGTALRFARNL